MKRLIIGLVALVVIVVAAGVYWFGIRDDAPSKLALDSTTGTGSGQVVTDPTGAWKVQPGVDTLAGMRIQEQFIGGLKHTAVGRTTKVTGSLTVAGSTVSKASFTVDLTALAFSDKPPGLDVANRSQALERTGLQTSQFPTASFTLTKPIDLGSVPTQNHDVTATATGDLTLHGVKKTITFKVDAVLSGATIQVASSDPVPVRLSDYDMDKPRLGPVADVAEQGSFEFKLTFVKS